MQAAYRKPVSSLPAVRKLSRARLMTGFDVGARARAPYYVTYYGERATTDRKRRDLWTKHLRIWRVYKELDTRVLSFGDSIAVAARCFQRCFSQAVAQAR